MALDQEWIDRLKAWTNKLETQFSTLLMAVELEGFVTDRQLSASEASGGDFQPFPPGTEWGGKWEYGWFRTEFALPAEAAGKRVHLLLQTGGEGTLVFDADGTVLSGRDWRHQGLVLSRNAQGGETFGLLAEVYAGHGRRKSHAGPVRPGEVVIPEPPERQQTVGQSEVIVWNEDAYQLWLDVKTLWELSEQLPEASLQRAQIEEALQEYTLIVDFELPDEEMLATFAAARRRLAPLLAYTNGTSAPTMFAFGHGHLDVAWLWPLAETERKAARTLANQLDLAEEYPAYAFLHSQPHLYRMVKQNYPRLYERVKQAVKDGKVIADGASWVEMDTNITGGEAMIRQFIHGKQFFRDEFGVDSEMLWLPDVFGYSAAMPQILRGCGVKYFSTQKLFWNYHGGETFPYNTFTWQGLDGSEVYVHLHNNYNSRTSPQHTCQRWDQREQSHGFSTRLFPFGHGDGGGGPERDHLEFLRRQEDLQGAPRMKLATPMDYFRDQDSKGWPEARYVGELYCLIHRGVLTSQAKTKKGNRKGELALREAETWGALAAAAKGFEFGPSTLDEMWKLILLNQFHDILPGSSVARVYEEAEAHYARVISEADAARNAATAALTDASDAVSVFNSLGWSRRVLVEVPAGAESLADANGSVLCAQEYDGKTVVETRVPSVGWTTLTPAGESRPCDGGDCGVSASETYLENNLLRVELNARGEIVSLFDKEAGREMAAGLCNELKMYKDVPTKFDAWDIDSMYQQQLMELPGEAEVEVITQGPLLGAVRIRRTLNHSQMEQIVSLRRGTKRVDFETTIEWNEDHKMLKVAFPVDVHTEEVISEIQFGHIRRPNHKSRPYDADRFEVCNHKWSALAEEARGVAVLNDCKYGLHASGNTIELTLLRAPKAPAEHADKGTQKFTYAVLPWSGPLAKSRVVHEAYDLNVPAVVASGSAGEGSLIGVDAANVIVETVKPAEDGSGDVVVRLYESARSATRCTLKTSLPVARAVETDMLENERAALECDGGSIVLDLGAFQVRTVRLTLAK
ncbi:MAG: alpha-mannosidase [Phycisphaerae bacterium]